MAKKPIRKVSRMRRPTIKPVDTAMPDTPAPDMSMSGMGASSPAMPAAKPAMGMGMKKGGSASSRADGIAMRGKTKGRIV